MDFPETKGNPSSSRNYLLWWIRMLNMFNQRWRKKFLLLSFFSPKARCLTHVKCTECIQIPELSRLLGGWFPNLLNHSWCFPSSVIRHSPVHQSLPPAIQKKIAHPQSLLALESPSMVKWQLLLHHHVSQVKTRISSLQGFWSWWQARFGNSPTWGRL